MSSEFIVTPKQDKSVTMTIRVDKEIQDKFDDLSKQSNRSRNELISLALEYALQNLKFIEKVNDGKKQK